ncbi:small ribosomal subunit protein mS35 [Bacillus rossius redtenbacheri]|uniref:small ribosomal subunit protein mS35 n=1 Tax=Bacillus rossius redtenbacheri TaxID=93214 RepID=UPI002FDE5B51
MSLIGKLLDKQFSAVKYICFALCPDRLFVIRSVSQHPVVQPDTDEFRVLDLRKKKVQATKRRRVEKGTVLPPRTNQMPVDQDWSNVWPGQRSFHPASVPLPIRQGYPKKRDVPPGKFANAELMKIPNFLHLTPPAIKKHCQALKRFCTAWPQGLNQERQERLFPVEVLTSDYCHSSPTIRDPMARIVTVKIKLKDLELDRHAKDKFLRLVGDRYNQDTDVVTIMTDRCPLRQQNYDFAMYILTALYHESWNVEPWESEKSEVDMEYYDWDTSVSRQCVTTMLGWPDKDCEPGPDDQPHVLEYRDAVSALRNEGEDDYTLYKYKQSVKKLVGLHEDQLSAVAKA